MLPLAAKASAVLRLLASAAAGLLAGARLAVSRHDLDAACFHLAAISATSVHIAAVDSPELLLEWGAAARAGLGLLPLLRGLASTPQAEHDDPSLASQAADLALTWQKSLSRFTSLARAFVESQSGRAALAGSATALRRTARMLQRLHAACCTTLHWLAAGVPAGVLGLHTLVEALRNLHSAAAAVLGMQAGPPDEPNRCAAGQCLSCEAFRRAQLALRLRC